MLIYLNILCYAGGTLWEGLRSLLLLKDMCQWDVLGSFRTLNIHSYLSLTVLWIRWKMSMTSHVPTCLLLCSSPNLSLSPSKTTSSKNKCFLIWLPLVIFYGSWKSNKSIGHIYRVGKCSFLYQLSPSLSWIFPLQSKYFVGCFVSSFICFRKVSIGMTFKKLLPIPKVKCSSSTFCF